MGMMHGDHTSSASSYPVDRPPISVQIGMMATWSGTNAFDYAFSSSDSYASSGACFVGNLLWSGIVLTHLTQDCPLPCQ
jgi:hypothetical protein